MEKLDLTKLHKNYFTAKTSPGLTTFELAAYISIPGKGDPSDDAFADHIAALYSVGYCLKFLSKNEGHDFVVSKLEGLWWYDENRFPGKTIETATEVPRSEWEYRLLIRLPDFITRQQVDAAVKEAALKKGISLISEVTFFEMEEGECVQMLHVGPFNTEVNTLREMADFMAAKNLIKNGLHHEIYLSDFRKTAPEKLKTILREPVKAG